MHVEGEGLGESLGGPHSRGCGMNSVPEDRLCQNVVLRLHDPQGWRPVDVEEPFLREDPQTIDLGRREAVRLEQKRPRGPAPHERHASPHVLHLQSPQRRPPHQDQADVVSRGHPEPPGHRQDPPGLQQVEEAPVRLDGVEEVLAARVDPSRGSVERPCQRQCHQREAIVAPGGEGAGVTGDQGHPGILVDRLQIESCGLDPPSRFASGGYLAGKGGQRSHQLHPGHSMGTVLESIQHLQSPSGSYDQNRALWPQGVRCRRREPIQECRDTVGAGRAGRPPGGDGSRHLAVHEERHLPGYLSPVGKAQSRSVSEGRGLHGHRPACGVPPLADPASIGVGLHLWETFEVDDPEWSWGTNESQGGDSDQQERSGDTTSSHAANVGEACRGEHQEGRHGRGRHRHHGPGQGTIRR